MAEAKKSAVKAAEAAEVAEEYTIEGLATAAAEGKLGGKRYSRAMVYAALRSAGKQRASVAEAVKIIADFGKKKVE